MVIGMVALLVIARVKDKVQVTEIEEISIEMIVVQEVEKEMTGM